LLISLKDVRHCLDKAAEMTEQYKLYVLAAASFPRSVDDLLWLCQEHEQKNITDVSLDLKDRTILGAYLNLGASYVIIVGANLNFCWKRFVLCKELFHVLLDAPEYRRMNIYEHLEEVKTTFPLLESRPGPSTVCEAMAEMAAMEFLFPYAARVEELEKNASPDYLAIAQKYKIPQVYVEEYMSPSYMENLGAMLRR